MKKKIKLKDPLATYHSPPKKKVIKRGDGLRWNKGKDPLYTIPLKLIRGAARVLYLATKREKDPYPIWNWATGMDWSIPYSCLIRHMDDWYCGEDFDPESGEHHLDHALCNLLFLIHYRDAYKEGDDRPKEFFKKGGI